MTCRRRGSSLLEHHRCYGAELGRRREPIGDGQSSVRNASMDAPRTIMVSVNLLPDQAQCKPFAGGLSREREGEFKVL